MFRGSARLLQSFHLLSFSPSSTSLFELVRRRAFRRNPTPVQSLRQSLLWNVIVARAAFLADERVTMRRVKRMSNGQARNRATKCWKKASLYGVSCNYRGVSSVGVTRRVASNIRERRCEAACSIISTMLVRSWGGIKRAVAAERNGDRGYRWCTVVEWKGVQSISRKSVCTARSPNAATLSSYSFDRNPLGLCTQSLMALFKDRYRSMTKPAPHDSRRPPAKERTSSVRPSYAHAFLLRLGSVFDEKKACACGREALNRLRTTDVARCQKANTSLAATGARSRWQRPENRANT